MDLYSGLPYWIAKNSLYDYYNPLNSNYETDVLIIGSGISGTLIAHELCNEGIECTIVDKRTLATGSSVASTALLQYEIDTPLYKMSKMIGEEKAVKAYRSCLQSIKDIEQVFKTIGYNPGFEKVPSLFYASNQKGLSLIKKEYQTRKKFKLPVNFLNEHELADKYGIKAPGALENNVSAQMDAYDAAIHLMAYHMQKHKLKVFTHTNIIDYKEEGIGYTLKTENHKIIKCRYVIIAAGFEAEQFLPKKVMKLTSTYAIISEPLDKDNLWHKRSLIWETKDPYLYIRTASKNRIIVGGGDENFKDPVLRDKLLKRKVKYLENRIKKLFPDLPFKTDMAWCGTFSSTKDGLPYIGCWPGKDKMIYALGYGGNGITFSMIAAQMIKNKIKGIEDDRNAVFGFER